MAEVLPIRRKTQFNQSINIHNFSDRNDRNSNKSLISVNLNLLSYK